MITFALGLFLITLLSSISGSHQATCDENEFACTDGTCIDSFLVCDGDQNCPDGSDETKSACPKTNIPCPPRAFRCAYGACIDEGKKCDGKKDCADGSDEKPSLCGATTSPVNTSESICPDGSFVCNSKQCINQYLVCDGEENCRDGSDETERSCINFPCPSLIGFQCAYGGCIDKDKRCNGKKDCNDGSDEDPTICTKIPKDPGFNPGVRSDVINCIKKVWLNLSPNNYKPNKVTTYLGDSNQFDKNIKLLEHCFTFVNPPQRIDETPDEIYGKYVATRLNTFKDDEKVELKNCIDRMLYFHYKNKGKGEKKCKRQCFKKLIE